jgi:beta-phosphoglucomutase
MDMGVEIINKVINKHLLIFDLDGTLVNTDDVNFLAYKDAIQKITNLDLALLHETDERFTREKLYSIIPNLQSQEHEKIIEMKNSAYEKYLHKSKVNNFILKIIDKFSQTNKIVLATNSHKDRANMILRHHGLINLFDNMFYKEDYKKQRNKFQHVFSFLGITDPSLVLVFEDDVNEILKAKLLGIPDNNIATHICQV